MRRWRDSFKLEDCEAHGPGSGAELFVVEGESAFIAVSQARDPGFQAVLPMRGKPLNALRAPAGKVAANRFYSALAEAIGTGWGAAFDASARRYDRVLLLMDPDADGIHCGALLTMFFYRWMQPLLDGGHLHRVHAPVGEVRGAGEEVPQFAFSDAQFQSLCAVRRADGGPAFMALRYRGLGSLNPEALATLCIHPDTRVTRPLGSADAEAAMEVFASLRQLPAQRPLL